MYLFTRYERLTAHENVYSIRSSGFPNNKIYTLKFKLHQGVLLGRGYITSGFCGLVMTRGTNKKFIEKFINLSKIQNIILLNIYKIYIAKFILRI